MPKHTKEIHRMLRRIETILIALPPSEKPFLLALSGGADSLFLYFLLAEFQKEHPFSFGVAHVDHGWRKESSEEGKKLHQLACSMGIPFHLSSVKMCPKKPNLEETARNMRYDFFKRICRKEGYQGIFLGHHKDDQAETVFKRCLEGAPLLKIAGMRSVSDRGGIPLIRPLLSLTKKEVVRLLGHVTTFPPFFDPTNRQVRFLRARLREKIFPFVKQEFGKNCTPPLAALAEEVAEMTEVVQREIAPILRSVEQRDKGGFIDFTPFPNVTTFEVKCVLREVIPKPVTRPLLTEVAQHLLKGSRQKKFSFRSVDIFVDRRTLSFEFEDMLV